MPKTSANVSAKGWMAAIFGTPGLSIILLVQGPEVQA